MGITLGYPLLRPREQSINKQFYEKVKIRKIEGVSG